MPKRAWEALRVTQEVVIAEESKEKNAVNWKGKENKAQQANDASMGI